MQKSIVVQNKPDISFIDTVKTFPNHVSRDIKRFKLIDILLLLLPLLAMFLWSISLQPISIKQMNDLGLVSVLSPKILVSMSILVVSFALTLQQRTTRTFLLALHLICIIIVLYGTPTLIEGTLHEAFMYRHAGYTEYIMRKGTVDPYLDTYFNWPGFFVLSALFTKLSGYSTILSYAGWAPIFYNFIYFGPMYMIFTSITSDRRLVWLSILFFYLTNWIGQDYFSPQGLDFFLYLVIIAVLLKWLRIPSRLQLQRQQVGQKNERFLMFKQNILEWLNAPDSNFQPIQIWQRRAVLCCVIFIFGLVVYSHPLTPFFTLMSITLLVVFRRCYPLWLPILFAVMTAFWIFVVAHPFVSQHSSMISDTLGNLTGNVPKSVTGSSLVGSPLYQIIAKFRLYTTLLVWFLALLGVVKRMYQGHRDITYILLAIAGFPLIVAQSYGGEMLLRIYLFTQPFMVFFAAALFYSKHTSRIRKTSHWLTLAIIAINLILLGSFLFTRYGDESVYYITATEWSSIQHLYDIAPPHSLFLTAWNDTPVAFKDYEKYDVQSLAYVAPTAVTDTQPDTVIRYIENQQDPTSYVIFTRGQLAALTAWSGEPHDILQRLETELLHSGKFKLLFGNSDVQVLQFIKK